MHEHRIRSIVESKINTGKLDFNSTFCVFSPKDFRSEQDRKNTLNDLKSIESAIVKFIKANADDVDWSNERSKNTFCEELSKKIASNKKRFIRAMDRAGKNGNSEWHKFNLWLDYFRNASKKDIETIAESIQEDIESIEPTDTSDTEKMLEQLIDVLGDPDTIPQAHELINQIANSPDVKLLREAMELIGNFIQDYARSIAEHARLTQQLETEKTRTKKLEHDNSVLSNRAEELKKRIGNLQIKIKNLEKTLSAIQQKNFHEKVATLSNEQIPFDVSYTENDRQVANQYDSMFEEIAQLDEMSVAQKYPLENDEQEDLYADLFGDIMSGTFEKKFQHALILLGSIKNNGSTAVYRQMGDIETTIKHTNEITPSNIDFSSLHDTLKKIMILTQVTQMPDILSHRTQMDDETPIDNYKLTNAGVGLANFYIQKWIREGKIDVQTLQIMYRNANQK